MKTTIYKIDDKKNSFSLIGKGEKGLLIIIDDQDMNSNLKTLEGMINAINFNIDIDTSIIKSSKKPIDINSVIFNGNYSSIIAIGLSTSDIGFSIQAKKYFFYNMEDFSILFTDSLSIMNNDKKIKLKFWSNLQAKFLN